MPRDSANARWHMKQCAVAARLLTTGVPERGTRWAWDTILDCGDEAPAALAAAARRLQTSRDTLELNAMIRAAEFVRDAGFFDAAIAVAGIQGATPEARAASLLVAAMETTDRTGFDLGELLAAGGPLPGCVGSLYDHSLRTGAGVPLGSDAGVRLRAAIAGISAAPDEPLVVQNAARCTERVAARVK